MWYTITLIVGIIILAVSLYFLKQSLSFIRSGERVTATVIDLEPVSGSDGVTYRPIFKYKTMLNQEMIYRSISSSSPPGWRIGEETTIAYDRDNPAKAKLLTYFGAFGVTVILMAIAMPMLVIGGGYYVSQYLLK